MPIAVLAFLVVWWVAWDRYDTPDGTIADLLMWLGVGTVLCIGAAWLVTQFG